MIADCMKNQVLEQQAVTVGVNRYTPTGTLQVPSLKQLLALTP